MLVKLRKVHGIPSGGPSADLYEWQPHNSKKWYLVHLSKIKVNNGHTNNRKLEQHQFRNQLFNALLIDLTVTVEARYDINDKKLTLTL